VASVQNMIESF